MSQIWERGELQPCCKAHVKLQPVNLGFVCSGSGRFRNTWECWCHLRTDIRCGQTSRQDSGYAQQGSSTACARLEQCEVEQQEWTFSSIAESNNAQSEITAITSLARLDSCVSISPDFS